MRWKISMSISLGITFLPLSRVLFFVRGDEIENTLYQGIAGQMINGAINEIPNGPLEHNVCFPLMHTHIPTLRYYPVLDGGGEDYSDAKYEGMVVSEGVLGTFSDVKIINQTKMFMYSPDLLFSMVDKTVPERKYYMQIIGYNTNASGLRISKTSTELMPNEYARDVRQFIISARAPVAVDTIIVDRGSNPQFGSHQVLSRALPGQFINIHLEAGPSQQLVQNRTMVSPRFMAIELPDELQNEYNQVNYLVNIYNEDPTLKGYFETIVNSYNSFNQTYSPFYTPIIGANNFMLPSFSLYGGNSFQTRIYFRQSHWESLYDISEERGDDQPNYHYFAHGLLLGIFFRI